MQDPQILVSNELSQGNSHRAVYQDFRAFVGELSENDHRCLGRTSLLFCYPVFGRNEFDPLEHPISQRILMAVAQSVGCQVAAEVASVESRGIDLPQEVAGCPDFVIIHPMVSVIEYLGTLVGFYRQRHPAARIVLQNSDQTQHEKVIGGPRGYEIASRLLATIPDVDYILLGFAEHALLQLLLGRATTSVLGHSGPGPHLPRLFRFASLPEPLTVPSQSGQGRSLRVQRSRGCLAPCTYCIEGQANRSVDGELSWDGLSMETFVDRLAGEARRGFFFINITDSSFEDPGPRGLKDLHRFCELITKRGISLSFKIHLRAENALKADDAELRLWKSAGIDVIVCGIESGNQNELDFYRKIATKEESRAAFRHLEKQEIFCNILGYIMFSPISTADIIREKVEFLRDINRGWDFLNLTNRLLVFWGTVIHQQLTEEGLVDPGEEGVGYVSYRFKDPLVERLDRDFNRFKKERSGFLSLNNLIYDSMNLESRMLNPVNSRYRELAGKAFDDFRAKLRERKARLSGLFCDGFLRFIENHSEPFLAGFDIDREYAHQQQEIQECLKFVMNLPSAPDTLYLHTWLSAVNRFGVSPRA